MLLYSKSVEVVWSVGQVTPGKGKEIKYPEIKMSEYLLPNDELSIDEQRNIFEIRNRMSNIPANYSSQI